MEPGRGSLQARPGEFKARPGWEEGSGEDQEGAANVLHAWRTSPERGKPGDCSLWECDPHLCNPSDGEEPTTSPPPPPVTYHIVFIWFHGDGAIDFLPSSDSEVVLQVEDSLLPVGIRGIGGCNKERPSSDPTQTLQRLLRAECFYHWSLTATHRNGNQQQYQSTGLSSH